MKVAVVGSGVYGGYISDKLSSVANLHIFEIKKEYSLPTDRISRYSVVGNIVYRGHSQGRRIGIGGTSNVWGGQEFTFSQVDTKFISRKNSFQSHLIISNSNDRNLESFFLKHGLWKWPWMKRARFSKSKRIEWTFEKVQKIEKESDGKKCIHTTKGVYPGFDVVFLSSGIFGNMDLMGITSCSFKDHISVSIGTIDSKDFPSFLYWRIGWKGLITRRLVFKDIATPHYVHFVFNKETRLVESVRKYIKGETTLKGIFPLVLSELPNWLGMFFSFTFRPANKSKVEVILDVEVLKISFNKLKEVIEANVDEGQLRSIHASICEELIKMGLSVSFKDFNITNYEDIYHPVGVKPPKSMTEYLKKSEGIYRIDTGLLETCGSTNPTATLYKLIDKILQYERL